MAAKTSKVDLVIAQVLSHAGDSAAAQMQSWRKPEPDIRRVVRSDYVRSVRNNLDYRGLKLMIDAFTRIEPGFNREPIAANKSVDWLEGFAERLRVHFKAAPLVGDEGMALRGFYVTRGRAALKRPLIYVNTAHHPTAVSATFCHEFGHHLSSELFGPQNEPVHFFIDADYATHLKEPHELAADAMVSLAAYPQPLARKIFPTEWNWGLVACARNLPEAALNEVRAHILRFYGFDLMERTPANQRLHYLSGMIHYAKLRWALLAEYDL
ncbi:MAG: hypothetical protein ACREQ4_18260 [Candidatus Binataceae bacterium]